MPPSKRNKKGETELAEANYKKMKENHAESIKKARATSGDRGSLGGPSNKYWYEKIDHWWEE